MAADISDLSVLAFIDRHGKPDIAALNLVDLCLDWTILNAVNFNAFA